MARAQSPQPDREPHGLPLALPLVGHDGQQSALAAAFTGGRMHHAWLLHGLRGVGKARFAAQAAAWLAAPQSRTSQTLLALDPDHPDARLVAQGAHPDMHWIDRTTGSDGRKPSRVVPVAQVRASLQKLQSTAAYGGWRVLVVDALDELNSEGANALLKPLEEPPQKTVILLVAHALSRVLPTIRSRCRHLAFSPLDAKALERLALASGMTSGAEPLIALAEGRPGQMLALHRNPSVLEDYTRFCALAAQAGPRIDSATQAARIGFAGAFNGRGPDERDMVLDLIEEWLSRRMRGLPEPGGMPVPAAALRLEAQQELAELWSDHTAATGVRRAINLDLSEAIMTLFGRLDRVYSQA